MNSSNSDNSILEINNETKPKKVLSKRNIKLKKKLENTNSLLTESNSTNFPSINFSSKSDRFEENNNIYTNSDTPGPGSYNIPSSFRQSFKYFSSKGYLNGFLSNENRFDERDEKLFYEKFKPGPGDYQLYKLNSLYDKMKKSLIGKSLYHKNNILNKNSSEEKKPDIYSYNPIKPISESYKQDNIFNSKIQRFKIIYNENPGPGSYYFNNNQFNKNMKSESSIFKKPINKKRDVLKELDIKTDNDLKLEYLENKFNNNINNKYNMKKTRNIKKNYSYNFEKPKNEKIKFDLGEKIDTNDIPVYNYSFETPKEELMKLASPRWKENKYEFKVPGPAYYRIHNLYNHLSFNRNNNLFNSNPGALYNYYYDNYFY